jgi:xanthine dehydrogenase accessory factor
VIIKEDEELEKKVDSIVENLYKTLINNVNDGDQCIMLTFLNLNSDRSGSIGKKIILTQEEINNRDFSLNDDIYREIYRSLDTGKIRIINIEENKAILMEPFIPKPRLIIFGGGHIAKPLSEFAARVGFAVTIIDDRPFFASSSRFPEAAKVICESFEKSFNTINLRKSDYVAIITRGHRHDGVVLREVLKHDLSYVGMIGSKRRVKGMIGELLNDGFSKDKLELVNSPIGLDIGAITPDEIAISIISQLISYKNKGTVNKYGESFTLPELDIEVAEKVFEKSSMPKALLTILSSKGSVPRKAGAKMVAYLDGRTVGSIGGGCSEAGVITKAREIMLHKGFLIEQVDMTGDVAEAEGMVCGGVMEVLVEVF